MLMVVLDPASPLYGFSLYPIHGPLLIVHCDSADLVKETISGCLLDYISYHLIYGMEVVMLLAEGEEKEVAKQKLALKLSREAFHAYFQEYRRIRIAAGKTLWRGLESPVLLKFSNVAAACGSCGALTSPDGRLKECGKCRVTYFCSRECQAKDWRTHKKACGVV
jgi:hypothetical protein